MTFPLFEMIGAVLRKEGNICAGYQKDETDWFLKDLADKHRPFPMAKHLSRLGQESRHRVRYHRITLR